MNFPRKRHKQSPSGMEMKSLEEQVSAPAVPYMAAVKKSLNGLTRMASIPLHSRQGYPFWSTAGFLLAVLWSVRFDRSHALFMLSLFPPPFLCSCSQRQSPEQCSTVLTRNLGSVLRTMCFSLYSYTQDVHNSKGVLVTRTKNKEGYKS